MIDNNLYARVDDCEKICKLVRSELPDYYEMQYNLAVSKHDEERAAFYCRQIRNHLLEETDNRMLQDRPYLEEWAVYREALRELPEQVGFPFEVTFPEKPEE